MIDMARWLAMIAVALAFGLAAVPARAQVFKPRDGSKTTEKAPDKSASSSPKKVADKKPSASPSHPAPKHARRPARRGGNDPDFVKITDDGDDE